MASPWNGSESSATGFDFGFNDQSNASNHATGVEQFSASRNEPRHISTTQRRPSNFPSASHSAQSAKKYNPRPYFHSRRIRKGTIDRPELREKDPRVIWATLIPAFGFVAGFGIIAVLTWSGYSSVSRHKYCEVFTDDFSSGFNSTIWTKHVETGGYG
jgi:hypothetical protein